MCCCDSIKFKIISRFFLYVSPTDFNKFQFAGFQKKASICEKCFILCVYLLDFSAAFLFGFTFYMFITNMEIIQNPTLLFQNVSGGTYSLISMGLNVKTVKYNRK